MALLENKSPLPPLTQAKALDPQYYTRSDVLKFDMNDIIASAWQIVAPASLVSGVGDVISRKIGNVPIIIVRTQSGDLNGFYNICPHRAGPLATCDARGTKRLRCGYHGWAYDHAGQLTSAPEMGNAQDFDLTEIRLTPIDVQEWQGLVFARAGGGLDFFDLMAGVNEIIGDSFNGLIHRSQRIYGVEANWKVYVDNYLEGYHLPFVHPSLTQVVNYPDYKTELGNWWSLQRSPIDAESAAYAQGEALYFFIYPNTMLNILPGRLQTNRVVPTGIDSCQVEFDYYYSPDQIFREEEDHVFSDLVQEEDRQICEHVQLGLASGVYSPGRLSPSRESGVWHWQNILRRAYQTIDKS